MMTEQQQALMPWFIGALTFLCGYVFHYCWHDMRGQDSKAVHVIMSFYWVAAAIGLGLTIHRLDAIFNNTLAVASLSFLAFSTGLSGGRSLAGLFRRRHDYQVREYGRDAYREVFVSDSIKGRNREARAVARIGTRAGDIGKP